MAEEAITEVNFLLKDLLPQILLICLSKDFGLTLSLALHSLTLQGWVIDKICKE
jgi:hypothetical protein